jgi:biotin-dependent carboxylase-like uncharacterized protein
MTPGLRVLTSGLYTTVQDLGRHRYQEIGVPVSGMLDGIALRLANALAGNTPDAAGLEILLQGPRLSVVADSVRIALGGAGASIDLGDGRQVPAWRSLSLSRGAEFQIVLGREAACCVLAVEGGIAVPLVLGSASTYVRGGIGGFEGRALRRDDILPLALARASERPELRLPAPPDAGRGRPVRVILGPQQDRFTDEALAALLESEFRISQNADRMGMRLDGPRLAHRAGWDIVSDAIATGAIQVPGSGQPILLLADHQTTGGYPKIATVVSADLPLVGRRRPGDALRFAAVTVEEAEALARAEAHRLAEMTRSLEPVRDAGIIDLVSLYGDNLISGVVGVDTSG